MDKVYRVDPRKVVAMEDAYTSGSDSIPAGVLVPATDSGWYAVMFENGDDIGEYLGYFQRGLNDARGVADELAADEEDGALSAGVEARRIAVYRLVEVGDDE